MSSVGGPRIVKDGLVLYLDAGNIKSYNNGETVIDLSTNKSTGFLINGVGYDEGNMGSFIFDGTNDYINGFDDFSLYSNLGFTINVWFNLTSYTNQYPCLFQFKTNTSNGFIVLLNISSSSYRGITFGSNSSWIRLKNDGTTFSTNQWYSVSIVYDSINPSSISSFKLYVNAVQQQLSTAGGFIVLSQINNIGNIENASRGYDSFHGYIPIVKVYNRALTESEIQQNYNANKNRFGL